MKRTRKICIVIFTIMLALGISLPANADIVSSSKMVSTIDPQLQTILQDATSNTKTPVDIWLCETSSNQTRETKIYSKIGINKAAILATDKNSISVEKIDEYIMTERAMYADERAEQYAKFRLDYSDIQGLNETAKSNTQLFYSRYAPMIRAELTTDEIKLLARDSRVQSIYYSPDVMLEVDSDVSFPLIRADYTRDVLNYTGRGINIGMIDVYGFPNKDQSYYTSSNIIYDPSIIPPEFDDHADMVATLMIAKETTVDGVTYEGIVPDATLYATYCDTTGDWYAKIEWLLDQGVHAINMSAGVKNANTYSTYEKWFDHIAIDHCIHFVKSAGNSYGNISSPGMAYNILTVGALNDRNTDTPDDDTKAAYSSYVESTGLTNKPDLMAPGVDIATAGETGQGTSAAAPIVAAVVAQLCEAQPYLRAFPERVKAILTASITHSEHTYNYGDANYDQYGAGVIDAKAALDTARRSRFYSTDFAANSAANTQKSYTFTISNPTRVRVSLSWLKSSTPSGAHTDLATNTFPLADLTLYIYGPDGEQIGDWDAENQNTQIADFIATETGTYRMVVKLNEPTTAFVYAALAWWFE